jgi:hypothetical protein
MPFFSKPLAFGKMANPNAKPRANKAGWVDGKQYAKHAKAKREEAKGKAARGRRRA